MHPGCFHEVRHVLFGELLRHAHTCELIWARVLDLWLRSFVASMPLSWWPSHTSLRRRGQKCFREKQFANRFRKQLATVFQKLLRKKDTKKKTLQTNLSNSCRATPSGCQQTWNSILCPFWLGPTSHPQAWDTQFQFRVPMKTLLSKSPSSFGPTPTCTLIIWRHWVNRLNNQVEVHESQPKTLGPRPAAGFLHRGFFGFF